MDLSSIKRLAFKNGQEATIKKSFLKDFMSDLTMIATKELARKIIQSATRVISYASIRDEQVYIPIGVNSRSAGENLARRIKALKWLQTKYISSPKKIVVESFLDSKTFSKQLEKLNSLQQKVALEVMKSKCIKIEMSVQTKASSNPEKRHKNVIKRMTRSILVETALTPFSLGLKLDVKYPQDKLDSIVDKGICKYPNAIELIKGILTQARKCSKRKIMIQSGLVNRDLMIIQKNFLIVASAVSALHVNPKLTVMFTKDGFVLFNRNRPVGRFGKKVKEKSMKALFARCEKECGAFPGKSKAIMDVIDAEEKKKDERLKEVFNDFAKHIKTNSGGPAAKAAKKLKKTAQVTEELKWSTFKKSFDEAAKHVKEIDFDPMVKDMEKTIKELNQGRNVLNLATMKWMDIFRKKNLKWLGTLVADILEEEVNKKPSALEALSCVANWLENEVDCKLEIKHIGSEGESVVLTPCKPFKSNKWKIELQDIMKSGPKWKKV